MAQRIEQVFSPSCYNSVVLLITMARILPFPALRYNPARVRLADVVTQPYDKITAEMQERYYAASPYNLVRIILGKREPGDNCQNVYTRAAAAFSQWREEEVFLRDPQPMLYAYAQEFAVPGSPEKSLERLGFIALGQLEPYDAGVVFRHEQTHSGPKTDRLNLLRATRAHFGQIFMLYNDPAGEIDNALAKVARYPADVEVRDEYDVRHRLWPIPGLVEFIRRRMENAQLIIADGHHRYETALAYRDECRAAAAKPDPDAPWEFVMATLVDMSDPGLVVLPTHRTIADLSSFQPQQFRQQLEKSFATEACPSLEKLLAAMKNGRHLIGMRDAIGFALLRPKDLDALRPLFANKPPLWHTLDVAILHLGILEAVLGIDEARLREEANVTYWREADQAAELVQAGQAQLAFFLNPTDVQDVKAVADARSRMPQKSTDFYPKLLSGIVINDLQTANGHE